MPSKTAIPVTHHTCWLHSSLTGAQKGFAPHWEPHDANKCSLSALNRLHPKWSTAYRAISPATEGFNAELFLVGCTCISRTVVVPIILWGLQHTQSFQLLQKVPECAASFAVLWLLDATEPCVAGVSILSPAPAFGLAAFTLPAFA